MKWVLLWFLGSTGVLVVASCIVVLFVRGRLRRRLRVDPSVKTGARATWLVDPRPAARLHRRLTGVGRLATRVADDHRVPRKLARRSPEQPPLVAIATDLRAGAVRVDHHITRAALLAPAARRAQLAELEGAVADLEQAAGRLAGLSADVLAPPVLATEAGDITDLAGQVERLAAAHRMLDELDARNGLQAQAIAGQSG